MNYRMFPNVSLPALTVGCLLTASTAMAQEVNFADIDGNIDGIEDGVLSVEELEQAFGYVPENILVLDLNGDGVTADEILAGADTDTDTVTDGTDVTDEDADRGHGNNLGGFDKDNPGLGHGNDGEVGGGRDRGDEDRGNNASDNRGNDRGGDDDSDNSED